jgi:hypothetical protein
MMPRRREACAVHRPALVDFVERRAHGPESAAALDHLARCARCERDLTEVAQTVMALRRLGQRASLVEAPADGWNALRERLERSQRAADDAARRFRRAFGGAVVSIAVVALVAIPSLTGTVITGRDDGLAPAPGSAQVIPPEARRYDPRAQPVTEGIVLAIAGRGASRAPLAKPASGGPMSTDRRDRARAAAMLPTTTQPSAPRTALRT